MGIMKDLEYLSKQCTPDPIHTGETQAKSDGVLIFFPTSCRTGYLAYIPHKSHENKEMLSLQKLTPP